MANTRTNALQMSQVQKKSKNWTDYQQGHLDFDNLQKLLSNEIPGIRWEGFLTRKMRQELSDIGHHQLMDACWNPHVKVAGGASNVHANGNEQHSYDLFIYFSQVSRARWLQRKLQRIGHCPYERLVRLLRSECGVQIKQRLSDDFGRYGDYFWLKTSAEGWPPLSIPQSPIPDIEQDRQTNVFWICLLDGYSEDSDLISYNSSQPPSITTQDDISYNQLIDVDLMYQQATPGTLILLNSENITELLPGSERLWIGGHLTLTDQMAFSWT